MSTLFLNFLIIFLFFENSYLNLQKTTVIKVPKSKDNVNIFLQKKELFFTILNFTIYNASFYLLVPHRFCYIQLVFHD